MDNDNTGSDCSFKLASSWLEDCVTNHTACAVFQGTVSTLPSRLIDVGPSDGSTEPFLYEGESVSSRYVTLSHCWGGSEVLTTTARTLAERRKSIPVSTMPQTFFDAVTIARKFDIRYLWIDSLCIIQDSLSDWEAESARMWDIYRNAVFNIAAKHSSSSRGGCFAPKSGSLARPCLLHFKLPQSDSSSDESILMCASLIEPNSEMEQWPRGAGPKVKSALDTRAWVLQEQILSTRTLQYHQSWVSWHCLTMDASEIVPIGIKTLRDHDHIGTLQSGISRRMTDPSASVAQDGYSVGKFHDAWYKTVEDYTARQMCFATDRLIALSGVADAVERATGDIYLAGLWEKSLHRDLTWCTLQGSTRFPKPLAPSWSWASVAGPVNWIHMDHAPLLTRPRLTCMVDILDAFVEGSPSSQQGRITIRGDVRPMFLEDAQRSRFYEAFRSEEAADGWRKGSDRFFGIRWYPDERVGTTTFLWFLAIAVDSHVHCIALLPTRRAKGEVRRVGFATWEKWRWFVGASDDGEKPKRPNLHGGQFSRARLVHKLAKTLHNAVSSHQRSNLPAESEYVGFTEVRRMKLTIV